MFTLKTLKSEYDIIVPEHRKEEFGVAKTINEGDIIKAIGDKQASGIIFCERIKKMSKTSFNRIVLKEYFCEQCHRNVTQKIEIPLGLNDKGSYSNNYCLNCDTRLRENDFKEISTDFNCPYCSSFLNSGFVKVCSGCGEFLSWVTLNREMFKLPKEEFKRQLTALLESRLDVEEPKNKQELEIKQFQCPFCEHKETLKVHERFWDDAAKNWSYFGIDYWECPKCGEENDIGLESFEKDFKVLFDGFMLFSLAKYYIQKQEFGKSLNIAKILVEIDTADICSKELIEKSEKGMRLIKKGGLL